MCKMTKTIVVLLFLVLLLGVSSIVNARWECYGMCTGCILYCPEDEITECCGCCEGGTEICCCFPDRGCRLVDP